jgi:tetratricopeptide (TPR) repeat protein
MSERLPLMRGLALVLLVLLLDVQPGPLALLKDFEPAQTASARQDYAAAAVALAEAAARLPYAGYVVYHAGLAEISAGRFDSAVQRIQTAATLDGWTPARRVALGDAYLGLGDHPAALTQWELALKDLPLDDPLLARLANSYQAVGRYAEAVQALDALVKVRQNDPTVYYRLALLTAVTNPSAALARLTILTDLAPNFAPQAEALKQAIETGQASGDEAYTFARVGFTLTQLKEWGLAELALTRAVTLNANYAEAYAYLGLAQDMQSKDGQTAYETAVKLAPESVLAQFFLGLHWRRVGNIDRALSALKQAQTLDPQNPAIAAEIGGAYVGLNDLVNAEVWFTQAVSFAPQSAEFWLLLARFYVDHAYHLEELGLPAARMAAGLDPQSAAAADALGYALVLTNDLANGEKTLNHALSLDPTLASAQYHLGMVYLAQGKKPEAEAAFNRAMRLDPDGAYGGLALKALAQLSP